MARKGKLVLTPDEAAAERVRAWHAAEAHHAAAVAWSKYADDVTDGARRARAANASAVAAERSRP